MFSKKYKVSIIDSKWKPIKRNFKMNYLPRKGEMILIDGVYYDIIGIIHQIMEKESFFVVVEIKFKEN